MRLFPWRTPADDFEERLRTALKGHSLGREVMVLFACILGFAVGERVLQIVFGLISPSLVDLSYHTAKVFFLLFVPVMLVGSSGVLRRATGPDLPRLALWVPQGWRWGGLFAVAAYLYFAVFPPWTAPVPTYDRLPDDYQPLLSVLLTFATVSLLEEAFYRVMLQSRLALLYGRWPGIVLTSLIYAVSSAIGLGVDTNPLVLVAMVVSVQGAAGLMYGYLWSRYHNLWLNFLLHTGVNAVALLPFLGWTGSV
ncbi:CPBP family intramembrane glutamic endopeptidase [Marinactinospora thermotolerans]|uniref:CPBP family intramembrane glutamic endopeptidase n=1 Tax=Marinactinospora thermotolerans TaxID=531310 RepID=UPI003D8A1F53